MRFAIRIRGSRRRWPGSAFATSLEADAIDLLESGRGGPVSLLDQARARAEGALGRGTDPARAALLRGFVLGQDDRIDAATVDEFRRSGLAHLLAVSGQNVLLLALLAWPLLALLGVPFRARLVCVLALIAVYVPIAGGGPSIQRAGVMGAAGVVAALAGRPTSRWYAVTLAAAVTLALNPRATGDVGWQLSFIALAGIMLWARPLAAALGGGTGPSRPTPLRTALAEGAAVTVAATVATAPLIAVHFDTVSIASLPANLLALPAVAPVMWLGMLAGLAGQASWVPVEPLTALAGALAGYIAQVAEWLGSPGWAQAQLDLGGPGAVVALYGALATGLTAGLRWRLRRLGTRRRRGKVTGGNRDRPGDRGVIAAAAVIPSPAEPPRSTPALRVSVLDVGQGDAILLEPRNGEPVLVDAGPAYAEVATELSERGIDRLGALVVTHPQSDHVGGAPEVLTRIEVERLLYARAGRTLRRIAGAAGAEPVANRGRFEAALGIAASIETLWPPPASLSSAGGEDLNRFSLVLMARWREFELLLTGDAEAEVAPFDPGPSTCSRSPTTAARTAGSIGCSSWHRRELALISVGAGNPYGHPAPETLADLDAASVPTLRTDSAGTVTIEVTREGWVVK